LYEKFAINNFKQHLPQGVFIFIIFIPKVFPNLKILIGHIDARF